MPRLEKQLFVRVDNQVGKLAEVTNKLRSCDINIHSLIAFGENGRGTLVLGTSDNERAKEFLRSSVRAMEEFPVLVVEVPDRVGAFDEVVQKVAAGGISIEWAVATTTGGDAAVVMTTNDNGRAIELV